jgi:hypothetical protein
MDQNEETEARLQALESLVRRVTSDADLLPGVVKASSAPIVLGTGKTAVIPMPGLTLNSVILASEKTAAGDGGASPTVKYGALTGDRVFGPAGSFKISALTNAGTGATNPNDASNIDWIVILIP